MEEPNMLGTVLVEMECIQARGEKKVVIATPGPLKGCFVVFSRATRVLGRRYRSYVYSTQREDADRPHCILVNAEGKRDLDAFKLIN